MKQERSNPYEGGRHGEDMWHFVSFAKKKKNVLRKLPGEEVHC